jgi:hypothetical protein
MLWLNTSTARRFCETGLCVTNQQTHISLFEASQPPTWWSGRAGSGKRTKLDALFVVFAKTMHLKQQRIMFLDGIQDFARTAELK